MLDSCICWVCALSQCKQTAGSVSLLVPCRDSLLYLLLGLAHRVFQLASSFSPLIALDNVQCNVIFIFADLYFSKLLLFTLALLSTLGDDCDCSFEPDTHPADIIFEQNESPPLKPGPSSNLSDTGVTSEYNLLIQCFKMI